MAHSDSTQLTGRQCAMDRRVAEIVDGIVGHKGKDCVNILVTHHSENDAQLFVAGVPQLFDDIAHSPFVVPHVADDVRAGRELLPSSSETRDRAYGREATSDIIVRDAEAKLTQNLDSGKSRHGVLDLIAAVQFVKKVVVCVADVERIAGNGSDIERVAGAGRRGRTDGREDILSEEDRSLHVGSLAYEDIGNRTLLANDGRSVWLDDAGFLGGNLLESVSEHVHVVKADVGDDTEFRMNDIGGVKPSAKSDLDDSDINTHVGEVLERHAHGGLEERRTYRFEVRLIAFDIVAYVLTVYLLSVDTYALPEVSDMRGGV